jgi:SAM-dependent methyltransferase
MSSAWLSTSLDTYEKHVALETVGQAAAIRAAIAEAVAVRQPRRFLYLGCAGGNGLEALGKAEVVGVDLNAEYLAKAAERWGTEHEWICCDLNAGLPECGSFELAFGALVFEYVVELEGLLRRLQECVRGELVVLLLGTREGAPAVAESPYRQQLMAVGQEFRYLDVGAFVELAERVGFRCGALTEVALPAGKYFTSIRLESQLS